MTNSPRTTPEMSRVLDSGAHGTRWTEGGFGRGRVLKKEFRIQLIMTSQDISGPVKLRFCPNFEIRSETAAISKVNGDSPVAPIVAHPIIGVRTAIERTATTTDAVAVVTATAPTGIAAAARATVGG